jgi:predicted amidohydrolase YtcJ
VIRRLAAGRPKGEWIVTMPVGAPPFYLDPPGGLAERRWPTRADLDSAAPDHPVYIRGIWGYWNKPPVYSIANSAALARAGLARDTVPPPGVEILRDVAGEPTGVFVEHNLIQVIEFTLMKDVPRFGHGDRVRALGESLRRYASRGVTAIYEGHGIAPGSARLPQAHERGRLNLRCSLALSPTWATAAELSAPFPTWPRGPAAGGGDDRLRLGGICLHYGGDPDVARILTRASRTPAWAGFVEARTGPAEYARKRSWRAAWPPHQHHRHAVPARGAGRVGGGRRALAHPRSALDARAPARGHGGPARAHPRARRRGHDGPISYLRHSARWVARLVGAVETLIPHRACRLGIPFGLATDNKPANPWLAFNAAVDRRDMDTGEILGAGQRLSRAQALRALTVGGARVTFAERERGILAPGFAADLAVLDVDPLTSPLDEVAEITARLTMVGGEVVHGDAG